MVGVRRRVVEDTCHSTDEDRERIVLNRRDRPTPFDPIVDLHGGAPEQARNLGIGQPDDPGGLKDRRSSEDPMDYLRSSSRHDIVYMSRTLGNSKQNWDLTAKSAVSAPAPSRRPRRSSPGRYADAPPAAAGAAAWRRTEFKGRVSVFLGWAVDDGRIKYNPAAGWRRPRATRAEQQERFGRALADEELPAFWGGGQRGTMAVRHVPQGAAALRSAAQRDGGYAMGGHRSGRVAQAAPFFTLHH
jgi:hypothetical protein